MRHATNLRAIALAAFATTAAVTLAAPTRAAVVQSAPASATFTGDLRFDPTSPSNNLAFDTSLGTLNTVTLSFDGTITARLGATFVGQGERPDAITALAGVYYSGDRSGTRVALLPIGLPVTPGADDGFSASYSLPETFALTISAGTYGTGAVYTDYRFVGGEFTGLNTLSDVGFTGSVVALFNYTPFENVPEPAALAVLGVGLLGLATSRFRRPA